MTFAPGPPKYRLYPIEDEPHPYPYPFTSSSNYHKIIPLQLKNKMIIMNATPMKNNNHDIQELLTLLGLNNVSMKTISTQTTEQLG
jgi:hypothetical protein